MSVFTLSQQTLSNLIGLGVAGNFAGHLEQAGETPDFVNVKTEHNDAPKGLFPYYVVGSSEQLGVFPWSSEQICYPQDLADNAHLQAEPEVCVLFDVTYENNQVLSLSPKAFAAFNDCSIRKPGAKKISEKKNWGHDTKGLAKDFIALSSFAAGCELDNFRIASFLKRNGEFHAYGKDSSVLTYSYFHQQLNDWMIERLNQQADFGPLEDLNAIIKTAGLPKQLLISLGATTYTEFGETVFLQPGDEVSIYVYDATQNSSDDVENHLHGKIDKLTNSSILQQKIV